MGDVTLGEDRTERPGDSRKGSWTPIRGFFALVGYVFFSLIAAAVLFELCAFGFSKGRRVFHPDPNELDVFASPAYANQPWAGEFIAEERRRWKEQRGSYVPFRIWGVTRWHGTYDNAEDTEMGVLRRTVNNLGEGCLGKPITKVWVFGGSTVYGTDVPDAATLPSYLSSALNADGRRCVQVANLGVEGYVTNQEVILLIEKLKAGFVPDEVVFYDGVNDAAVGAFSPADATAHQSLDLFRARMENSTANKLPFLYESYSVKLARGLLRHLHLAKASNAPPEGELARVVTATVDNYSANLEIVRLLAEKYHFKAHFFWQPAFIFGEKHLTTFEQEVARARVEASGDQFGRALSAVYCEAERRAKASKAFVFLGRVLDESKDPLYVDGWMHLSPRGNEIVARALADKIEAQNESRR